MKGRLVCAYELPAGQTRNQALSHDLHRLQDRLHTYSSLIHVLRCTDSDNSSQILDHLRRGKYDSSLPCNDFASETVPHADRVYPWEESPTKDPLQSPSWDNNLPPIHDLMPIQSDSSAIRSTWHSTSGILRDSHKHFPSYDGSAQTSTMSYVPQPGPTSMITPAQTAAEVSTISRR